MPEQIDNEEPKGAIKEALREWLDEKYAQFGKWTFHGLMAMVIVGLTYLALIEHGWHK